ncbi:MAG: hypothetical protein K9L89_05525 [Kiritimatiellales bacterium]|nr:hypothetical protein [Kiritimatiellales bacterium]
MKFSEVAENVKQLADNPPPKDEFIFELLLAYGSPKATISRLKAGQLNLAKTPCDVLLKKKVWFRPVNVPQASRLLNVPQASRLPGGTESPRKAGGTEPVIEEAIELIISGEILNYQYDAETKLIKRKMKRIST